MSARQDLIRIVQEHLPAGADPALELDDESVLTDLGFTSLHLVTLMLALQDSFAVPLDELIADGMPITFGDLLACVGATQRVSAAGT